MSNEYDKLEISLSSYENEHYINFQKIDTEIGQVFTFKIETDSDTINEISKMFDLEIDTMPF